MKKVIWAFIALIVMSLTLPGCMGDVLEVAVVINNSTQYELETVTFQIPQSSGTYSPMSYIITTDDEPLKPDEEREVVISFVETDFGNSGSAIVGAKEYISPERKDYTKGEVILERGTNRFKITHDGETFVISAYEDTDDSTVPASRNAKPDRSAAPQASFTLTLFADFPGETWTKEAEPLPIGNEPASPSLIAFYLAEQLSAWTGFDFALNDVSVDEDSVTVDWSKDSTLIAGTDGSNRKEHFGVLDGVSLNWFMMDSLAMTLKNNLYVTTVYYCSDGGSVTFYNPDDMAEQGLPELPADQSYEGSAFFITHAGGRGDLSPIDKDQAEDIVKKATKVEALEIERTGGKPDYTYNGEGEIGHCKAWFFSLCGNGNEHRYAVNERSELWGMDTFGKWQLLLAE